MSDKRYPPISVPGCAAWLMLLVLACVQPALAQEQPLQHSNVPIIAPPEGNAALVPLGDAVNGANIEFPATLRNPFEHDPVAVAEGKKLFAKMNCAGCHGYDATGAMGPNLTDKYWRYGGTPVQVFKSIYEGRPNGMPAWGGSLSVNELWQIVTYLESLGGTYATDFYRQAKQGDHEGDLTAGEFAGINADLPKAQH